MNDKTLTNSEFKREQKYWLSVLVFFLIVQISALFGHYYFKSQSESLQTELIGGIDLANSEIAEFEKRLTRIETTKSTEDDTIKEEVRELDQDFSNFVRSLNRRFRTTMTTRKCLIGVSMAVSRRLGSISRLVVSISEG